MRQRRTVYLNILLVLGLVCSGLALSGPPANGMSPAPAVTMQVVNSEEVGPRQRIHARKQDRQRIERERARKHDRTQADRKHERQRNGKRAKAAPPEPGRVGDWQEYCSSSEGIRLLQSELCTHGPDEVPAGFDITQAVPLLSGEAAAEHVAAIACDGDGQSGYRTQVLYVRASDRPDNYDATLSSIQAWAAETDLIFRTSSADTGPTRSLRFVQDASTCLPTVDNVELSPAGDGSFSTTINELWAKGYNRQDRIYLMFVDANFYCGVGTWWDDDRSEGNKNYSNYGPSYARVDRGCWSGSVAAHEVMHNLGGVQDSAPNSSKGAHCIDEYDIMCYSDSPDYPRMQTICPDSEFNWTLLDCNHDDYFHTNPDPGSYLATYWNPANNQFLTNAPAPPPQPVVEPPPPTVDTIPLPPSTKDKKCKKKR